MFYHLVCPDPDEVNLATKNPDYATYLATEMFNYVCQGTLILSTTNSNTCSVSGNAAVWDLSTSGGNLPTCGKPFFTYNLTYILFFCHLRTLLVV